jgi:hypothetical protein
MRTIPMLASAVTAVALGASAAVTVTYGDPDRFTDVSDRNSDPRKIMQVLSTFLQKLGDKTLPKGTDVKIEVLDLDRAGRPRMNLPTETRVMTGKADMPCIDLKYSLESGGQVIKSERERVCDADYLRPLPFKTNENDPLAYEKRMLEEWFKARFSPARKP